MLNILRDLFPMAGVLHIGAGQGASADRYREWGASVACFVEADDSRAQQLQAVLKGQESFFALNALVAGEVGETPFFVASNRNESGLIEPQALRSIWRNLETLGQESRSATTIAEILRENAGRWKQAGPNWIVIDCLPALPLLKGAGRYLDDWDVVTARVVIDDALSQQQPELGRATLDAFLSAHDFRPVAIEAERSSLIAQIVYARDWKHRLRSSLLEATAREKQRVGALSTARDEQAARAKRLEEELEAAKAALAKAQAPADARNEPPALTRGHDEPSTPPSKEAADALARAEQATKQIRSEQAGAAEQKDKLKACEAQNAELIDKAVALEKRIKELTQELSVVQDEARQERARLEKEFARAEAQIDLIRSLLVNLAAT